MAVVDKHRSQTIDTQHRVSPPHPHSAKIYAETGGVCVSDQPTAVLLAAHTRSDYGTK